MTVKEIKLTCQARSEKNGKAKKIRAGGFIPAVLYGSGVESKLLTIKNLDFTKAFGLAGESNLIDLIVNKDESIKVIVKDIARDPISNNILHVDLYKVDMSKKITTEIPLNFIGEAKAAKELGGILIKGIDHIEVECLPADLVDHIDVDLSSLNTFDDIIKISDLNLAKSVKFVGDENEIVASISEIMEEEEKEPSSAEATAGKGEEIEKEKDRGDKEAPAEVPEQKDEK